VHGPVWQPVTTARNLIIGLSPSMETVMAIHRALFSSHLLNSEFNFTLDPCANRRNAKCSAYFTKRDDGLSKDWGTHAVFCNPPYGTHMRAWARKCFEASRGGATVVLLAHSRTDTRWFHDWVYGKANEIRFVRGRLKFGDGKQSAPFPSLVAVYRPTTKH
jgi:phage N-6-adenine-methyltransferase